MADSSWPVDGRQQFMSQQRDARYKEKLPRTQPEVRKLPNPAGADQRPMIPIKLEHTSEYGDDDCSSAPSPVWDASRSRQTLGPMFPSTPSTADRALFVTIGALPTTGVSSRYDYLAMHSSASANDPSMLQDHELFSVDTTTGSRRYKARLRALSGTQGAWRTRRSRSASPSAFPRQTEEESFCSYGSYGHRNQVSRPTSQIALGYGEGTGQEATELEKKYQQIRKYEQDIVMVDQEAAEAETEYYRLKLEESIQKRDNFREIVEQQNLRMPHPTPQGPNLLGGPSAMAAQQGPTIDPWRHNNANRLEPAHMVHSGNHANYNPRSELPAIAAYGNPMVDPRSFANTSRLEPAPMVYHNIPASPNYWIPGNTFFQQVAGNSQQEIPHQQGVAATNPTQVPQISAVPTYAQELDDFKQRIDATIARGCAPPSGPQIPPRATKHDHLSPLSKNRMLAACYGGDRDKDLNLCLWVFNSRGKCPDGGSCGSRHEPLDQEELEWIRTNLVPHHHMSTKGWQWHHFLRELWHNYIKPAAPERSRFDLTQGQDV